MTLDLSDDRLLSRALVIEYTYDRETLTYIQKNFNACIYMYLRTYICTHICLTLHQLSSEKYSSSSPSSSRMQCKNGMLTLYNYYVFPALPEHTAENSCIVFDCREGRGVIIGNTQSVSIPFLFLFFFHLSSLYPIKIFAKCFIY